MGQEDLGEQWGWGNGKEAELGVTGQKRGSPLQGAAPSLLVTTSGGLKWVVNQVWVSWKGLPALC